MFASLLIVTAWVAAASIRPSAQAGPAPGGRDLSKVPVQTVWPPPPDAARVKFIAAYANSEDVGAARRTKTGSLKDTLLGQNRSGGGRAPASSFSKPFGVAGDRYGRIIVADGAQASVVVVDPQRHVFTSLGGATHQALFRVPLSVAVDSSGNIYVGDVGLGRVLVFGSDLGYRSTIGTGAEITSPSGLAVDETRNRLYVVDSRKHALLVFELSSGRLSRKVGTRGADRGQFNFPTAVAVGPDGRVYVTDTLNYRVQVFSPDLDVLLTFGSLGVNPGQFRRPKGIAVDADNVVFVVDSDFNNFQMFTPEGQPLMWVGEFGNRPGQMVLPAGIAIDRERRRIYVCEQINKRVQVFERVGG